MEIKKQNFNYFEQLKIAWGNWLMSVSKNEAVAEVNVYSKHKVTISND
jgi:hypothetical protein